MPHHSKKIGKKICDKLFSGDIDDKTLQDALEDPMVMACAFEMMRDMIVGKLKKALADRK